MIHKQQMGHSVSDILYGLCEALARNYLNNLGLGKEMLAPVVFQGGVAANQGMIRAFEEALKTKVVVPEHHHIMGAIGAALLAHEHVEATGQKRSFRGFGVSDLNYPHLLLRVQGLLEPVRDRGDPAWKRSCWPAGAAAAASGMLDAGKSEYIDRAAPTPTSTQLASSVPRTNGRFLMEMLRNDDPILRAVRAGVHHRHAIRAW